MCPLPTDNRSVRASLLPWFAANVFHIRRKLL
jgi:hypothetical protein